MLPCHIQGPSCFEELSIVAVRVVGVIIKDVGKPFSSF